MGLLLRPSQMTEKYIYIYVLSKKEVGVKSKTGTELHHQVYVFTANLTIEMKTWD